MFTHRHRVAIVLALLTATAAAQDPPRYFPPPPSPVDGNPPQRDAGWTPRATPVRPSPRAEATPAVYTTPAPQTYQPPSLPDAAGQQEISADVQTAANACNAFGLDLYRQLCRTTDGNLLISPISIWTALSMTYAGARGTTATELARVLHIALPSERLHSASAGLQSAIQRAALADGTQLRIANRLWGQGDFRAEFLDLLKRDYAADLEPLDFSRPDAACVRINDWAKQATAGKIDNLVSPAVVSPDTKLVLTNAVYFRADWQSPFNPHHTIQDEFGVSPQEKIQVSMMYQPGRFRYAQANGVQVLELPYAGGALSMIILLPSDELGLDVLIARLGAASLRQLLTSLAYRDLLVYLPRFRMESDLRLRSALTALGLSAAFDGQTADFSGMTGRRDICLSDTIHKAIAKVDEKGSEIAATTATTLSLACHPQPITFKADRPFLLIVRDTQSEAILFMGRIVR